MAPQRCLRRFASGSSRPGERGPATELAIRGWGSPTGRSNKAPVVAMVPATGSP
jgi:hypothetical protein